jgi:rod shape-determining protein MreD
MNFLSPILLLLLASLAVFFEAWFQGFRIYLGAQVHFLPILMVYASLTYGLGSVAALAIVGGFLFDSLSGNPLGVTTLALFVIGWGLARYKGLLLRELGYAQFILGLAACAAMPVMVLIELLALDANPMVGIGSLWQWGIAALAGGILTPFCFKFLDRVELAFNYQPVQASAFRPDRQIKRGRF